MSYSDTYDWRFCLVLRVFAFGKYSVDEKGNQTTGNGQYCAHLRLSTHLGLNKGLVGHEQRHGETDASQG
eukprot:Skav222547  [mRNA]  locus=scaffold2837:64305:69959:- [translate_table: standard]